MENEKTLVPSVEKIDKIFNYLYMNEKASQAEIARELNIPKATVHRLLYSLVQLNYLFFNGKDYFLGNKFQYFSNKDDKFKILKNISLPYLEELSLKFKETFKLSILDKNKIRVIAKMESNDFYKITVPDNAVFPLHAGAASKLLICQLSEKKLNSLLPKVLPKYTEHTIIDRDKLKSELFKINIKKIAFDNREHSNSISAVATPILDKNNKIVACLSCPFFNLIEDQKNLDEIILSMKDVCKKISDSLSNFNF